VRWAHSTGISGRPGLRRIFFSRVCDPWEAGTLTAAMLVPALALALTTQITSPAPHAQAVPAEPDPLSEVSITWSGSPACDGGPALRTRLRQLLTASTTEKKEEKEEKEEKERKERKEKATGSIDAELMPSPALSGESSSPDDSWTMTLAISSSSGRWSRRIDDESCGRMIEVAALIAAIYLDPLALQATLAVADEGVVQSPNTAPPSPPAAGGSVSSGGRSTQVEDLSSLDTEAASAPPSQQSAPPSRRQSAPVKLAGPTGDSSAARRPSKLGAAARAAFLGSYGPFPGFGALFVGGVGLTSGDRLLLEIAVLHRLRSRHAVENVPEVELLASLTGARADACWTPHRRRLELPLCAGLDLGALNVEAIGIRNAELDRSLYIAPHLGGRILWRPSPTVGIGLDLGVNVTLRQRTYSIDELAAPVLQTTRASASMGVGLEIRLPGSAAVKRREKQEEERREKREERRKKREERATKPQSAGDPRDGHLADAPA